MSDEQREQGRDGSAVTGDSRTEQHPVPSYAGAGAPASEQAGAPGHRAGPPPGPYGPSDRFFPPPPGHFTGPPTTTVAPQPRRQRGLTTVVAAALVAGLVGGGAGFGGAYALLGDGGGTTLSSSPPSSGAVDATPGTVTAAAQTVLPSTVDIRAGTAQGAAEGSGVVLSASGDVLTNNHVVAGSQEITVTLADGSEHPATVVGTAPSYDLAVIRLQGASGLTPATLGESGSLQVGQQVVAIGSPRGLTGTVTTGIVSALDRTVAVPGEDGSAVVYNGLQTDAPINQGNSGGPLVNLDGQVVGINSAIATSGQNTGSIGLGFAIPIDQARRVAQEILDTGTATKPVLGVQGSIDAGTDDGAPLAAVQPGSPAEAAGLQAGDVVTRVDDAHVADFADLMARIGAHGPGDQVTLTVTGQGGAERTVQVTLGSQPDQAATTSPGSQNRTPYGGNPFGNPFGGGN